MRKRMLLTAGLLVLSMTALGNAQSLSKTTNLQESKIGVTLDLTYVSKWLSKGVRAYGNKGGLFKTIDLDFYGTGFGIKTTHRNATSGGYVDNQRFDFRPYYKNCLFEDTAYLTNYNISVGYEYYPGLDRHRANTTYEWIYAFSWPELLPNGLVPKYIAHYEYPAGSDDNNRKITGWVHRFILGKNVYVQDFKNPLYLSGELAYADGLGGVGHDWAYFTAGISTKFDITDNISFVPGLYQQISMEDTVNTNDDTYVQLSMKYKF